MRARRGTTLVACFAALVSGGFVSLFTAGPALFADGDFAQRPPVLVASVVAFALVGLTVGFAAPGAWKSAAVCLAVSALPVVVLLGAGFMLGDAAGGVLGVWVGAVWRLRRSARRHGLRS